jgi:hypothetical protein
MLLSLLKRRTRIALRKNKTERGSVSYAKVKSVGIVYTVEDRKKHDDIKDLARRLEQDGKKVQVITFLPKKKENFEFLHDFFTLNDYSFWGKLRSAAATRFADTSFDILFCIDTEPNPMVANLLALSKARCRIGKFREEDQPLFELMIGQNGEVRPLMDNMYKYATRIR